MNRNIIYNLVVTLLLSLDLEAQSPPNTNAQKFVGLEVYSDNDVLKLSHESLLCSAYNKKWKVRAFTLIELNHNKVLDLQNFILQNKYFLKDTLIDNSFIKVYDGSPVEISIKIGHHTMAEIRFVDNENMCDDKIDSLIILANQIIPSQHRKQYSIKRNLRCKNSNLRL